MKSATIPPLRMSPELRRDAEDVLREGETLSGFVEESLRRQIECRKLQRSFVERGLAARDRARASGQYAAKEEVMDSLRSIRERARRDR